MTRLTLITEDTGFLELEDEWKAILPQTPANTIFLTWEWLSTWWEAFGRGKQLYVLTFREGSNLVGVLPCYLHKRPLRPFGKIRELRFLGTGESVRSEYLDFICLPEYREECLAELAEHIFRYRNWDIAVFSDLAADSGLAGFPARGFPRAEIINREPCYSVEIPADFETYLKGIDARMRRNIRNRRRNLERDFRLEYHRLQDAEDLERWMEDFQRLHAARLKERGLPSKFSDPRYALFHSRLSRIFRESGWLFAVDLRLDGEMVAARYNFLYNGTVYDYQTGYAPEYGQRGIMQALISYAIEDCTREGIGKFDFLAGDDDYKRHFSNSEGTVVSFRIYNRTAKAGLHRLLSGAKKWFGRQ